MTKFEFGMEDEFDGEAIARDGFDETLIGVHVKVAGGVWALPFVIRFFWVDGLDKRLDAIWEHFVDVSKLKAVV